MFSVGDRVKVNRVYHAKATSFAWGPDPEVTEGVHTVTEVWGSDKEWVVCDGALGSELMFHVNEIDLVGPAIIEEFIETVVSAAIKVADPEWGEVIISAPPPARHHNMLFAYHNMTGKALKNAENQGFLTSTGRFVDRKTAMQIVLSANQPLIDHPSRVEGVLFSEDLW